MSPTLVDWLIITNVVIMFECTQLCCDIIMLHRACASLKLSCCKEPSFPPKQQQQRSGVVTTPLGSYVQKVPLVSPRFIYAKGAPFCVVFFKNGQHACIAVYTNIEYTSPTLKVSCMHQVKRCITTMMIAERCTHVITMFSCCLHTRKSSLWLLFIHTDKKHHCAHSMITAPFGICFAGR